jgi:hypothetical protein
MSEHPNRLSDPLLGKMWKTKSARFNAHARLLTKHWLSTTATAILSFYLIVASLIPLAYEASLAPEGTKFLSVITLVISILLIIVTLIESARNYHGEAERMHKCALAISEIYNRFQAMTKEVADQNRIGLNDEYSKILVKYELNHKDIDFIRFQIAAANDLKLRGARWVWHVVKYVVLWSSEYALYVVIMAAPPLFALGYLVRTRS